MITGRELLRRLQAHGVEGAVAVPCSLLTPLLGATAAAGVRGYLRASNEGEAVAIAAGAWLAGRRVVVMMQNSGLGNALNPLASLCAPARVPVLLLVTWRGRPGTRDEPQHELMGRITEPCLSLLGIEHVVLSPEPAELEAALARAAAALEARRSFALLLPEGVLAPEPLVSLPVAARTPCTSEDLRAHRERPTRAELLVRVLGAVPADAALVATTGKCARELFELGDRTTSFYLVGAMGCAGSLGLGIALHTPRRVVVLDGDGALLMRLEALAALGAAALPNLTHVVLDNGVHDSTGGQATAAPGANLAALAATLGYGRASRVDTVDGFGQELVRALTSPVTSLIQADVRPGSSTRLGRPTIGPDGIAARFRAAMV